MKLQQRFSVAIATTLILSSTVLTAFTSIARSHSSQSHTQNSSSVKAAEPSLTPVAQSENLWNVVAVSSTGRIFASFPRWLGENSVSVGEVQKDGSIQAFPGNQWNQWQSGRSPAEQFVNVNSVYVDSQDQLWVVNSAAPNFGTVVPGGAKLVQIDLATNQVQRVYRFDAQIAPEKSVLNDVRVRDGYAYITESGLGAIIVVNLQSGEARRLLADHASTKSDPTLVPTVEGREFRNAEGRVPQTHANGLALSPDGQWLYFQPTYGPTLRRVATADLRNPNLSEPELGDRGESIGRTVAAGGMFMDRRGILYLSSFEDNSITLRCPNGQLKTWVQDDRLLWPDGGSVGSDGYFYFPVAQVHRIPRFNGGTDLTQKPFDLFKVNTSTQICQSS
ncbi:MAG: major royal jelly family protein [Oculatellaceae cyanobacterium Prado106]|jgi:sugar lactone lactonase YvrE|nr:major royal jelly family protein [Oculatellaceae cyanobacterium Prado106]